MSETRRRPHRPRVVLLRLATALAVLVGALAGSAGTAAPDARAASASGIEEITRFGSNPGDLRMFTYVPEGLTQGAPLVVALHGCTQDATGYGTGTGWVELAERGGFALLLPQQRSINNGNECFNWFRAADSARGSGEAASIAQMRRHMIENVGVAPERVHVTGLSAGGAMTAVMLAAYPDHYAGGGIVAGVPYRCAEFLYQAYGCMNPGEDHTPRYWGDLVRAAGEHTGTFPTVGIWHGDADTTVAPANQRELAEQWTDVHGTDAQADLRDTVAGYPHAVYRDSSGRKVVETYTITGMGHGQPVDAGGGCGTPAPYIVDVNLCAAGTMATSWGLVSIAQ